YSRRLQLEPELPMDIADLARVQREWFARPGDGLLSLGMASRGVDLGQAEATPLRVLRRDWDGARALGVPITLHVGRPREVTVLEQEEMLGPDVQLVHPTRTTAAERKILAARGTSFSLSPHTEVRRLKEAGDAQLAELLEAGVQVGLS